MTFIWLHPSFALAAPRWICVCLGEWLLLSRPAAEWICRRSTPAPSDSRSGLDWAQGKHEADGLLAARLPKIEGGGSRNVCLYTRAIAEIMQLAPPICPETERSADFCLSGEWGGDSSTPPRAGTDQIMQRAKTRHLKQLNKPPAANTQHLGTWQPSDATWAVWIDWIAEAGGGQRRYASSETQESQDHRTQREGTPPSPENNSERRSDHQLGCRPELPRGRDLRWGILVVCSGSGPPGTGRAASTCFTSGGLAAALFAQCPAHLSSSAEIFFNYCNIWLRHQIRAGRLAGVLVRGSGIHRRQHQILAAGRCFASELL
jgi:hypothetical protein